MKLLKNLFGGSPSKSDDKSSVSNASSTHESNGTDHSSQKKKIDKFFASQYNRHCAFVFGPHRCMGSNLARLEIRVALEEWLKRIPEFSIEEGAAIEVNYGAVVSLAALPLVW